MGEFDYKGEGKPLMGCYVIQDGAVPPAGSRAMTLDDIRAALPDHYRSVVLARLPTIPVVRAFDQHTFTVVVDESGRIIEAVQG